MTNMLFKAWISSLLVITSLLVASTYASRALAVEFDYLAIGQSTAPMQFSGEHEVLGKGIITEIVQAIFQDSKHTLTPRLVPWPRQKQRILSNKYPYWIIYTIPEWIDFKAIFTEPVFSWKHVLVKEKLPEFKPLNAEKKLILVHNYDYPGLTPWLAQNDIKSIAYAPSPHSAIQMLSLHRGTMFVGEKGRVSYNLNKLELSPERFIFEDFSEVIHDSQVVFALSPNTPEDVVLEINQKIAALKDSGFIDRILDAYHWEI